MHKDLKLDEIKKKAFALLPELKSRYGVEEMWVFGSFVRGEATSGSDLDILVSIDNPNLSLLDFIEIEIFLSETLGLPVDLVEKEALKPAIGKRVLREAQPV